MTVDWACFTMGLKTSILTRALPTGLGQFYLTVFL